MNLGDLDLEIRREPGAVRSCQRAPSEARSTVEVRLVFDDFLDCCVALL